MAAHEEDYVYRTDGKRFGKGLAIIVIVMAVGAAIQLSYSDLWHKYPPLNQLKLAKQTTAAAVGPVKPTGVVHTYNLAFTETSDLRTLGFNAPKGDPNANPPIEVKAGDTVIINVVNNGKMPHAFGVVSDPDNPNTIAFPDAKFKSPDNPILHGESGTVKFVADTPGHYYYICTVPGHAALGMKGDLVVEKPEGGAPAAGPVKPTGVSHSFDLAFTETSDLRTLGFNAPNGKPNSNPVIEVKAGDTVIINVVNNGKMPHAFGVVSDPDNPNTIAFPDAKFKSPDNPILHGESGTVKFVADTPGHYYYICTVPGHAALGMKGDFDVD